MNSLRARPLGGNAKRSRLPVAATGAVGASRWLSIATLFNEYADSEVRMS